MLRWADLLLHSYGDRCPSAVLERVTRGPRYSCRPGYDEMKRAAIVVAAAAALAAAAPVAGQDMVMPAPDLTIRLECCQPGETGVTPFASMNGRRLTTPGELQVPYPDMASPSDVDGSSMAVRNNHRIRAYALWGGLGGAVAGGVLGLAILATADDWVGPPPFIVTVPAGALAGALLGAAVGALAN